MLDTQRVSSQLQTILPILRDHSGITHLLGQKVQERVLQRYTLKDNVTALEQLYGQMMTRQLVCEQRA